MPDRLCICLSPGYTTIKLLKYIPFIVERENCIYYKVTHKTYKSNLDFLNIKTECNNRTTMQLTNTKLRTLISNEASMFVPKRVRIRFNSS